MISSLRRPNTSTEVQYIKYALTDFPKLSSRCFIQRQYTYMDSTNKPVFSLSGNISINETVSYIIMGNNPDTQKHNQSSTNRSHQ